MINLQLLVHPDRVEGAAESVVRSSGREQLCALFVLPLPDTDHDQLAAPLHDRLEQLGHLGDVAVEDGLLDLVHVFEGVLVVRGADELFYHPHHRVVHV